MFEHLDQLPALQTAYRLRFFHSNQVSHGALIGSVVRVKLFGSFDYLTKLRMGHPTNNGDDDRLVHFVGYDLADPIFPKMPLRRFRLLRLRSRHRASTFRMHSLLIHFTISSTSQRPLRQRSFAFARSKWFRCAPLRGGGSEARWVSQCFQPVAGAGD